MRVEEVPKDLSPLSTAVARAVHDTNLYLQRLQVIESPAESESPLQMELAGISTPPTEMSPKKISNASNLPEIVPQRLALAFEEAERPATAMATDNPFLRVVGLCGPHQLWHLQQSSEVDVSVAARNELKRLEDPFLWHSTSVILDRLVEGSSEVQLARLLAQPCVQNSEILSEIIIDEMQLSRQRNLRVKSLILPLLLLMGCVLAANAWLSRTVAQVSSIELALVRDIDDTAFLPSNRYAVMVRGCTSMSLIERAEKWTSLPMVERCLSPSKQNAIVVRGCTAMSLSNRVEKCTSLPMVERCLSPSKQNAIVVRGCTAISLSSRVEKWTSLPMVKRRLLNEALSIASNLGYLQPPNPHVVSRKSQFRPRARSFFQMYRMPTDTRRLVPRKFQQRSSARYFFLSYRKPPDPWYWVSRKLLQLRSSTRYLFLSYRKPPDPWYWVSRKFLQLRSSARYFFLSYRKPPDPWYWVSRNVLQLRSSTRYLFLSYRKPPDPAAQSVSWKLKTQSSSARYLFLSYRKPPDPAEQSVSWKLLSRFARTQCSLLAYRKPPDPRYWVSWKLLSRFARTQCSLLAYRKPPDPRYWVSWKLLSRFARTRCSLLAYRKPPDPWI